MCRLSGVCTCSGVLGAEGAGLSAVCTCSGVFGAEGAALLFGKADSLLKSCQCFVRDVAVLLRVKMLPWQWEDGTPVYRT